jgi:cytochrome c
MNSYDYDDEPLKYEWTVNGRQVSNEKKPVLNFDKNGVYQIILKVTDTSNSASSDTLKFIAGNTAPEVKINTTDNSTFFFTGKTGFSYNVKVSDKEANNIDYNKLKVISRFIPKVEGGTKEQGHQLITADYNLGKILISGSDCKACHQLNGKSVGPAFIEISNKYKNNKDAPGYLSAKIITGGGGVWGEHAMSAHPQLSKEDATEMAKYVLSLGNQQKQELLPAADSLVLSDHSSNNEEGRYIFTASYTDDGNGQESLTGTNTLILRPSKVQVENADVLYNIKRDEGVLHSTRNSSYFMMKEIDLKDIHRLTYRLFPRNGNSKIEVHAGSLRGKLISSLMLNGSVNDYIEVSGPVEDPGGINDLYFVITQQNINEKSDCLIDWIRFEGGRIITVDKAAIKKDDKTVINKKHVAPGPKGNTASINRNGARLIMQSDCNVCHAPDKKLIGPSYKQISLKYKNNPATISALADKIINGGAGNWGDIRMTPHPQFSRQQALEIVKYLLVQKK